jgi:hypothetical protein
MENLDPRQIQTIKATVIKLGRIDDVDHMNKWSKFHWDRARGSAPMNTWNITLLWLFMHGFPFLSFPFIPFILFSCSPPQVERVNRFPWLMAQTMRFHPRKCLFGVSLKKFEFTGSITPKNRQKVGVVYGFPAKLGESIKTHISVKSRDIDTKFEL